MRKLIETGENHDQYRVESFMSNHIFGDQTSVVSVVVKAFNNGDLDESLEIFNDWLYEVDTEDGTSSFVTNDEGYQRLKNDAEDAENFDYLGYLDELNPFNPLLDVDYDQYILVSDWLASRLIGKLEYVIKIGGWNWWFRTSGGQSWFIDSVIWEIAQDNVHDILSYAERQGV